MKNLMKKYRVNEDLVFYVSNILDRRCVKHQMVEENGTHYCLQEISNKNFHKLIIRASMERLTIESDAPIPYIAEVEQDDLRVLAEMFELGGAYAVKKNV